MRVINPVCLVFMHGTDLNLVLAQSVWRLVTFSKILGMLVKGHTHTHSLLGKDQEMTCDASYQPGHEP